jgi:hypothetical protein
MKKLQAIRDRSDIIFLLYSPPAPFKFFSRKFLDCAFFKISIFENFPTYYSQVENEKYMRGEEHNKYLQ